MAKKDKIEKAEAATEAKEEAKVSAPGPKKIKVSLEELARLQAEEKLIGWDPATGEALVK